VKKRKNHINPTYSIGYTLTHETNEQVGPFVITTSGNISKIRISKIFLSCNSLSTLI